MVKVAKVGVHEILSIEPGQTKTFILPTGAARASAMTQIYKAPLLNPRVHVERYSCRSLKPTEEGFGLEVTAIKK